MQEEEFSEETYWQRSARYELTSFHASWPNPKNFFNLFISNLKHIESKAFEVYKHHYC